MKKQVLNQLESLIKKLNEEQKQLLADTINHGSWGSCDEYFDGEYVDVWGYIPDEAYRGGHFERRGLSNRFRSLYKALGLDGNKYHKENDTMKWNYDWWGDGSGSILLIRGELAEELEEWAKSYNK